MSDVGAMGRDASNNSFLGTRAAIGASTIIAHDIADGFGCSDVSAGDNLEALFSGCCNY